MLTSLIGSTLVVVDADPSAVPVVELIDLLFKFSWEKLQHSRL